MEPEFPSEDILFLLSWWWWWWWWWIVLSSLNQPSSCHRCVISQRKKRTPPFVSPFHHWEIKSEVSKRGWREGVGVKQTPQKS